MPTHEVRRFLNDLVPVAEGSEFTVEDIQGARRTNRLARTLLKALSDSKTSLPQRIDRIGVALTRAKLNGNRGFDILDEDMGFMDTGSPTKRVYPPQAHEIVFAFSDGRKASAISKVLETAITHTQAIITADRINRGQVKALILSETDVKDLKRAKDNSNLRKLNGIDFTHIEIYAHLNTTRALAIELSKSIFRHRKSTIITENYIPQY